MFLGIEGILPILVWLNILKDVGHFPYQSAHRKYFIFLPSHMFFIFPFTGPNNI